VASNSDDEMSGTGRDRDFEPLFGGMARAELERLTVDAILQYRASVALAEALRLELVAAEAEASCAPERLAELQHSYERAETDHRARQLVLNNLIDRLGYVPKMPIN
jgi:hypothetical protein